MAAMASSMSCLACEPESDSGGPDGARETKALSEDALLSIFSLLSFKDVRACALTCHRWRRILAASDAPWRSAFGRDWPALEPYGTPQSFRTLGMRMTNLRLHRPRLSDLRFAITIRVNGTAANPAFPSAAGARRYLPTPPVVGVSHVVAYTNTTSVSTHGNLDLGHAGFGHGIQFTTLLPLPAAYPTEAAPDGRSVVVLSPADLVDAMWREADKRWEADGGPDGGVDGGPDGRSAYLELDIVVINSCSGSLMHLTRLQPLRPPRSRTWWLFARRQSEAPAAGSI